MTEVVVYLALATIAVVTVGFMLGMTASEIRWHRANRRRRRRRQGVTR
jgi:hypothetical protein